MAKEPQQQVVSIDGKQYDLKNLSKESRAALGGLSAADGEIKRLKLQLTLAQTARMAFANSLKTSLPQ